jgi:hypothetical protein
MSEDCSRLIYPSNLRSEVLFDLFLDALRDCHPAA